jgi:hypothetical protein
LGKTPGEAVVAFRGIRTLGIGNDIAFGAETPRPTRSRTYASPISLPGPTQGSLPARAGSPRPGGIRTRWTTNEVSWSHRNPPIPFDQQGLVAPSLRCPAEDTKRTIDEEGEESFVIQADVTRADDCKRMADACAEKYGRIDILHNNVGIGGGGGAVELSKEVWDKVVDTDLESMFLTCECVLPYMDKQGSGAIVSVPSMAAVRFAPYPMLAYSSSKAGVRAFTRSLAMQYALQGVRSNCIVPGLINTPMAIEGLSGSIARNSLFSTVGNTAANG